MTEDRREYLRAYKLAKKNGTWKPMPKKPKQTEAEKKAYKKAYREANKEKIAARMKAYRAKNKEKKKAYNAANKEEIKAYNKEYSAAHYQNNKESRIKSAKAYYESKKPPFNIVYCIPDYDGKGGHYAGVTNSVYSRMSQHKHYGKLNTENWFILDVVIDRDEALMSEARFHTQGYDGKSGAPKII